MSLENYLKFEKQPDAERRAVFEAAALKRGISPSYAEKDYWVCRTLLLLMRMQPWKPKRYFKGGTSLSKGFGCIERFSEDIDFVFSRDGLGFSGDEDPTDHRVEMSRKKRQEAFKPLIEASSAYVRVQLASRLMENLPSACKLTIECQTGRDAVLEVGYPSLFETDEYVKPRVRLEGGARSALSPLTEQTVTPYAQEVLAGNAIDLSVPRVTMIAPERTFLDKLLAVHSANSRFATDGGGERDANRIARHYYDIAKMSDHHIGKQAMADLELFEHVREHSRLVLPEKWRNYDAAKPGTLVIVPPDNMMEYLADDYQAMRGMMFNNPPSFDWIIERLRSIHQVMNDAK